MEFDARQFLINLNCKGAVEPKLLFKGEVVKATEPRISTIAGFPDACTYRLGQEAKWQEQKTNIAARLAKDIADKKAEQEKLRKERGVKEIKVWEEEERIRIVKEKEKEKEWKVWEEEGRRIWEEEIEEEEEEIKGIKERVKSRKKELTALVEREEKVSKQVKEAYKERTLSKAYIQRSSIAFETGKQVHNEVRKVKTRKEILAEKKIFLLEDIGDWFQINDKLKEGFTIQGNESSLYLIFKGLQITGHPDHFELTPAGVLSLEEWKTSKTGKLEESQRNQTYLYASALREIFSLEEVNCMVRIWNKSTHPFLDRRLLQKLKTGEVEVPISPTSSHSFTLDGQSKVVKEILDFTYELYTAQTPCSELVSGLCQNWCPIHSQCPAFKEVRQFVTNFKVEVV